MARVSVWSRSLGWLASVLLAAASVLGAEVFKFEAGRKGVATVADPAATGKQAMAINVEAESGKAVLGQLKKPLAPGWYRFAPRLRLTCRRTMTSHA